jgi:hypothetical protein
LFLRKSMAPKSPVRDAPGRHLKRVCRAADNPTALDKRQAKRDIAFGTMGLIWGGFIVVSGIFGAISTDPSASSAYNAGRLSGVVFGALFAAAGYYYRRRGYQTRQRLKENDRGRPR